MSTLTVYGGTDGHVFNAITQSGNTWTTCVDSASGTANQTTDYYIQSRKNDFNTTFQCYRGFVIFDLSSLPAGAAINSATIYLRGKAKGGGLTRSYKLTKATHTTIDNNTFNDKTDDVLSDTAVAQADWDTTNYNSYVLNSTGLGLITAGDYKISIRESLDISKTTPDRNANATIDNTYIQVYASATAGTDYDPYMVVDYTVATGNKIVGIL